MPHKIVYNNHSIDTRSIFYETICHKIYILFLKSWIEEVLAGLKLLTLPQATTSAEFLNCAHFLV